MSRHLGMDEFTIFFLMIIDMMSLLAISLDVHMFILSMLAGSLGAHGAYV
jgi:hypothetical protein